MSQFECRCNMPPECRRANEIHGHGSHGVDYQRPDKNIVYVIYPGDAVLRWKMTLQNPDSAAAGGTTSKVETTELGKEIVGGHPCVKNKAVVTGQQGENHA